jgi:hypothetical protein
MTDRVKGFTVTLAYDIREDDFQRVIDAVKLFSFVKDVTPVISDSFDFITENRVRLEIREKVLAVLQAKDSFARTN